MPGQPKARCSRAIRKLLEATKAVVVRRCGLNWSEEANCFPLGGNFRSVSVRIGSQKAALAGLPMGWGLSPVFHPCQGQRRTRSHCGSVCTPHHLLRAPCQKRTQEQASGYWITSATARSDGGTARPSAFAVLRLMISSNLLGCSTGISPGFVPRRILSTMSAACRNRLA